MKPTTPTISVIGNTMPQMLRGGGIGAAIGGSTAILPPPVAGGRDRFTRTHERLSRHHTTLTPREADRH